MTDQNTQGGAGGAGGGQGGQQGDGGAPAPFFSGFQGEVKTWVETKGFKDPEALAMSSMNLEKLLGADRSGRTVVLPKDENDVEGRKAFLAKLGVPDTADGYNLPVPEGGSDEFAKTAADWFHKAGVPPQAARTVAEAWNGYMQKAMADAEAAATVESQKQLDAVKGEWGQKFDENSELARRYVKETGLSTEQLAAVEEALGTATFLKTFHKLGTQMGEASFTTGDGQGGGGFNAANAQAKQQLHDLRMQRIEGKISQDEFLKRSEELNSKIAA